MTVTGAVTRYFTTFEDREEAFREGVFSLVARKHLGPTRFWNDFKRISLENLLAFVREPVACITSDPRDCLAFGTPWQVLSAAVRTACQIGTDLNMTAAQLAERVGLTENLHQPVRTLSGGETVKLTLAKARAATVFSRRMAVSSPFCWLSAQNRIHFDDLLEDCAHRHVEVNIFALEGEDDLRPVSEADVLRLNSTPSVPFFLDLQGLRIPLTPAMGLLGEKTAFATVADFKADLVSPCLWVGNNGQGKSLVAKALARTTAHSGKARVRGPSGAESARLLFQDVMTQTLLRSLDALEQFFGSAQEQKAAKAIGGRILDGCRASAPAVPESGNQGGLARHDTSLLAIKSALVAARLGVRPGALILDEPDWGLTRRTAIDFVLSVIGEAHGMGVPVILISHKPWWTPLARSRVAVSRSDRSVSAKTAGSFDIRLSVDGRGHP
ncbi:MAG: hypothetical protein JEZ11_11125 [Desulfobacterales bacterium]|nr:hypothetical protein [Desulfobacterales bacterium]